MKWTLSPRLQMVAEQIPMGARLADVGTDHAYLPAWLLERERIPRAIATDLRPGPLARAAETVRIHGVEDRVSLRLGNGLAPVNADEVDAVAIAGMGGETILAILAQAPWAAGKVCVVQPMSSAEDLRRGLNSLGLHIVRERTAVEGDTVYVSMTLAAGIDAQPLSAGECWVGRTTCHEGDPTWPIYLAQEKRRLEKVLTGLRHSNKPGDSSRREQAEEILRHIDTLIERWEE